MAGKLRIGTDQAISVMSWKGWLYRQLWQTANFQAGLSELALGGHGLPAENTDAMSFYVIAGRGKIHHNGRQSYYEPGALLNIEPSDVCSFDCKTTTVLFSVRCTPNFMPIVRPRTLYAGQSLPFRRADQPLLRRQNEIIYMLSGNMTVRIPDSTTTNAELPDTLHPSEYLIADEETDYYLHNRSDRDALFLIGYLRQTVHDQTQNAASTTKF